ncbi:MAG: tetratricopeptide repeat protein [Deltaproteobacteria bacterium]|nr:tetratricopeptide repeat protein [Deltaproteobacteria bacterium]
MRTVDRSLTLLMPWRALVLVTALLLCACTTSSSRRSAEIEIEGNRGFTITEQVRLSSTSKSEFKKALRLLEEERYEDGIELLESVTKAAPDATAAHIDLGIAYRLAGDFEKAEASLSSALELNPRHPVAHNELGIVYRKTGRFQEARESYERALAVYGDFHFARRNLAILCDVYLGDMACAVKHYERYAQVMPDDENVAIWIADLRNRMGR